MSRKIFFIVLILMLAQAALTVPAQSDSLPDTYSFQGISSATGPPTNLQVNRNGSKEVIERTRPAKQGEWDEYHVRTLYDFQAHKVYDIDLIGKSCWVQKYDSSNAPSMFDPIGQAEQMAAELAKEKQQFIRREKINGIPAKMFEVTLPKNQGKYKIWLEEKYNFEVKWVMAMAGEPEETQFEIRQLSYKPSPAALFMPPKECKQIGGAAAATESHSEVKIDVKIPEQTVDLTPGKASDGKPETQAVKPLEKSGVTRVTAVQMRVVPESYSGPCPGRVQLIGEITTDGPGTVWYRFLAGAISHSPEGTLQFEAAGTKKIKIDGSFNSTPRVTHASFIAAMQNAQGKHGPKTVNSGPVNYDFTCTP